ncbi:TPR repeat-containing protein [alpha proteobacterium U9-1i]|nr:TPR repeat-containing protein [alpha proteobacterium U9-1i]
MSVLVEAITVVVKANAIEKALPGGLRAFESAAPNSTFRSDGLLAAVGFMTPTDVEVFVRGLERDGLRHIRNGEAIDLAVVDQIHGPTVPCDWLDVAADEQGNMTASMRNAPPRPMATAANWRPGNKLTFRLGSGEDLEIDEETGLRYFVDADGRKQYMGQRFEEDDPHARLMLATPRLLHFAKAEVWNSLIKKGWQGLAHSRSPDPSHHLAMRFKNQLGLIYVDAAWTDTPLTTFDPKRRASLIDLAASMRGVPIIARCKLFAAIHMRSRSRNEPQDGHVRLDLGPGDLRVDDPVLESMALVDARSDRVIDETRFDLRQTIEISDWELLDFATQVARSKLEEDGYAIESWTTEKNSDPHIVASKDGTVHRVIVGPGRYPVAEPIYDQNRLMAAAEETLISGGGLFKVPVLIANAEDKFAGKFVRPLYRGEGAFIKYVGLEPVDPGTVFSGRAVKVFISSTFKDFEAEREALARHVLPELQRRAADRGVSVSLVDLRWGVPRSDVEASQEVASCLREIASSHPFFVALLGKRHGALASKAALSHLAPRDAWLQQRAGMSITELEIAYSMLKPNAVNSSALVFARSKSKPFSKQRAPDVDRRYKPLLAALTARGYAIELMDENFPAVAQDQLWALIERHYPHVPSADTGLSSARRHRQFAFHAASMLPHDATDVGAGALAFASSWEACAAAGSVGLARRRREHLVFEHFFALEGADAPLRALNRRLLEFKQRTTREVGGGHTSIGSIAFTREVLEALKDWSSRAGREVFLVLAETDRLADEVLPLLALLEDALPGRFSATSVGESAAEPTCDSARFLSHYLALSGKVLDADDADLLLKHPLGRELSFLRFAADHLVDAATNANLGTRLREVVATQTFEQLSHLILARIERQCAPDDPWRKIVERGRESTGFMGAGVAPDAALSPASYFRIQAALSPMTEHWGDWVRLHAGPFWTKLMAELIE